MTNEEAIKRLKEAQDARVMSIDGIAVDKVETELWQETVKIALKALKKQIPKSKHKYQGYRCVCGSEVAKNQDYCECCGQRLLPYEEKTNNL